MSELITLKHLNVVKIVNSEFKARRLEVMGFKRVVSEVNTADNHLEKPLDEMTVAELEKYAIEKGIDLTGTKNKAEKLDRIKEIEAGGE